ncbi:hypothetical protein HDU77_011413 [Chytriomyces hyalinus]|nr:hypothetical protein HDU77_011413 [Chytriomyces hyalinus]
MKPSVTYFAFLLAFIYGALLPLASSAEPVPMAPAQQLGRRAPLVHHTTSKHHTSLTRHTTYTKHTKRTSKTTTKGTHTKKSSKKTTKLITTKAHAGKTSRRTTSKLNANANVVPSASSSKPPSSTAKSTATTQSKPASSPSPTKSSSTTAAPKPTTTNSNKPSSSSSPAKSTTTAAAPKPSTSTQTVKGAGSSSSSVKPASTLLSPTKTTSSSLVPTKTTSASSTAKSSSTASAPKPTATTQTVMGAGNSPTSSAKPDASPSPTKSTSVLPTSSSKPDASPSPTKSTSVLPTSSSKPDASPSPTKSTSVLPTSSSKPDASPSPPKSTSILPTSSSKPDTKSTSIVATSSSKPAATSQSVKISGTSSPPPSGSPSSTGKPTATSQTTSTASGEASAPGYTGVPPGPGAYLYSDPSQLTEPQVLTSANGFLNITLTVKVARHTGFISFNSRQYSCNGITAIPGPTWNITAGDTVVLTIINELEANNDADDLVDMTLMNTMHSPNSTNVHTHGLHVSSSQDNVFQRIYPGETFQYKYTIPEDHAPGLHWYHSHKHGTSALQVMGGLVGAIYVRPTEAAVKKSAALTYLASLERHVLVGQHFAMASINSDTDDTFTVRTYEYLSSLLKSQVPINAEYFNSSVKDIYFINGQFQPKLAMMPGTPVVLDIVNAVGDVVIELDIRDSPQASSVSSSCSLVQIASDGIYFTSVRTLGYVAMVPGNRVSIIIQCTKPGTFYLTNVPDDSLRPGITDNETRFQQSMVTLVVGGTETTEFTSYSSLDLSTIVRPTQLKDTLNTVVTSKWELSVEQEPATTRSMTWLGMGSDCSIESTGRDSDGTATSASSNTNCQYLSFPGELSTTGPYRHITYVGAVDELIINGRGKSAHSVHIHVNHFQVVSDDMSDDAQRYFYRIGDWRDTIPAVPGRVKVRQNVQDFSGEVVVHCHFLMHEDMGMMATYYVRAANESSKGYCTYPGGTGTSGSCALSDGVVLSSATLSAAAAKTNSPVTSK